MYNLENGDEEMEIKCTVEEFKDLLKKETSVAGTTDVKVELDGKEITSNLINKKIKSNGRDTILQV